MFALNSSQQLQSAGGVTTHGDGEAEGHTGAGEEEAEGHTGTDDGDSEQKGGSDSEAEGLDVSEGNTALGEVDTVKLALDVADTEALLLALAEEVPDKEADDDADTEAVEVDDNEAVEVDENETVEVVDCEEAEEGLAEGDVEDEGVLVPELEGLDVELKLALGELEEEGVADVLGLAEDVVDGEELEVEEGDPDEVPD